MNSKELSENGLKRTMPLSLSASEAVPYGFDRDHNGGRSYVIPVWNGILDHRKTIGPALWIFLWCLDRITREDEDTRLGFVLGGAEVAAARIAQELHDSERTVRRHLKQLAGHGYLLLKRVPYGFVITVTNSRKFKIWRSDSNGHLDRTKLPIRSSKSAAQTDKTVRSNKEDTAVDPAQRQLLPPTPLCEGGPSPVVQNRVNLTPRDRRDFFAELKQIFAASIGADLDEEIAIQIACVRTGTPLEAAKEWVALSYGNEIKTVTEKGVA